MVRAELDKVDPLRTILQKFDIVIHCAASMDFGIDSNPPKVKELYRVNVDGTANLVKAAASAGVKQFIYVSSTEAIAPTLGEEPADENTAPNAVFEYGRTKILAEQEIIASCANYPIHYTIVRPTGILGAGDLASAHQLFWGVNMGLFFFVPGSVHAPSSRVCYTHVSDIVKGITLTVGNPKAYEQTYILCTNSMSYEALIRRSCHALGRMQPLFYLPYGFVRQAIGIAAPFFKLKFPTVFLFQPVMIDQLRVNRIYSAEKAQKELGWTPNYSMEDAVDDMIRVQKTVGALAVHPISPVALILLGLVILLLFFLIVF